METSDISTIYIYKKLSVKDRLMNKMLGEYWFLPSTHLKGQASAPLLLYQTKGVNIKGAMVHSILCSTKEKEIIETDADAIFTDFWFTPVEYKLRSLVNSIKKPVIISLNKGMRTMEKIIDIAIMFEQAGVSAILTGNLFKSSVIEKIKKYVEIPIIAKADANPQSIVSKYKAGAEIICIIGMEISRNLLDEVKQAFPALPILSFAGNSEEIIANSLSSGADAIIYKPLLTVDYLY
jgi:hypothetical protein